MGRGRPFKPGNQGGPGGHRENAGRKPNWLKQVCDTELEKRQLPQLMGKIAAGEPIVTEYKDAAGKKQTLTRVPSLKEMQEAVQWLADRGHGRPSQEIQHQGIEGVDLFALIAQAESERGLESSQ